MKTKSFFMHVSAAAAVICAMFVMVSCDKDDPLLPEVIESEVYEVGEAGEVTAQSGTEGTSLSYESWIMVRGMTRASFDNRVSVTLNNEFANVDSIIRVSTFELGEMRTALVYETAGNRQEDFVTVTDSVLVYKVMFNEFEFSYDLYHEIAVYDDGVTRQTMPYHPIRNVRDNGYEVEDLDFVTEDNGEGGKIVYLRKLLKHSIAVDFNGETYTVRFLDVSPLCEGPWAAYSLMLLPLSFGEQCSVIETFYPKRAQLMAKAFAALFAADAPYAPKKQDNDVLDALEQVNAGVAMILARMNGGGALHADSVGRERDAMAKLAESFKERKAYREGFTRSQQKARKDDKS